MMKKVKQNMTKKEKSSWTRRMKQPQARQYRGVIWHKQVGMWMAVRTWPLGHEPRQEFLCFSKSQKKCAEKLAQKKRCSVQSLRIGNASSGPGKAEKNTVRLYRGVFYRRQQKVWVAQITHPCGHRPRQEVVGSKYPTQKAAAEAMAKALNKLRLKKKLSNQGQKVTVGKLRLNKKLIYQGHIAMQQAIKKFKVLNKLFVKKKLFPGCTSGIEERGLEKWANVPFLEGRLE